MLVRYSKQEAKSDRKKCFVINDYGQLMEVNEAVYPWQKIVAHGPQPVGSRIMPDSRGIVRHNERVSKVFDQCTNDHDWRWKPRKGD